MGLLMVRPGNFEIPTLALKGRCSASELWAQSLSSLGGAIANPSNLLRAVATYHERV